MDPIQIEKFRAKKRHMRNAFPMYRFIRFSLSALCLALFLSSPLWLPRVIYSTGFCLRVLLPAIGPKCLFFICNVIIVFLLGECRRSGSSISSSSSSSSTTPGLYEEYVEKSRSMRAAKLSSMEYKDTGGAVEQVMKPVPPPLVAPVPPCQRFSDPPLLAETEEEEAEEEEEEEAGVAEDADGDELNKRVEDFIARINAQRKLEARKLQVRTSS